VRGAEIPLRAPRPAYVEPVERVRYTGIECFPSRLPVSIPMNPGAE
jgi:hypothetical protein